jgi:uncharacterized protein YuzE
MKVTYDPEVDCLNVIFSDAPVVESDEEKTGIIIDYDKDGNPVSLEILGASKRMGKPASVEYSVLLGQQAS